MNKVTVLSTPFNEYFKRAYLPLIFYATCKNCKAELDRDVSSDYIGEIVINEITDVKLVCECGVDTLIKYKLTLNCEVYEDNDERSNKMKDSLIDKNITDEGLRLLKRLKDMYIRCEYRDVILWMDTTDDRNEQIEYAKLAAVGYVECRYMGKRNWGLTQRGLDFINTL